MRFYRLVAVLLCSFIIGIFFAITGFAEDNSAVKIEAVPTAVATGAPEEEAPATITTPEAAPAIITTPEAAPGARLWNLQDADILSVINEVAQETGKNFVVDPRVNGKITLISNKPLRQKEVYQVFLSILELLGYSAIPNGNVVKIIPSMESGEHATPVVNRRGQARGAEVVVRVVPLENVSATQLIPVLRPLLPQWSNIAAYTPGNVLILLGRAANLQRIVDIIQDVDKASSNSIDVIPLRRASAAQVATVLTNLQNASRATGETPSVSIATDERSNSILLGGPKAARLRMRVLISQLDAPAAAPAGNTEVIYLRYLQAKTFAPLLNKIAQNILGKENNSSQPSSAAQPGSAGPSSTASDTSIGAIIQAEPNTNAVVITAPPSLMQALRTVIRKLDIRPAQVLVEAIIAEIDESDLKSLGIQWGNPTESGDPNDAAAASVTAFPKLGAGIIGIIPRTQIHAVLSILQNTNGVDILSTPSVVVLDNQKATIEVGQDVPYQIGQYATTASTTTVTPFTTTTPKPVTLKLVVTPQINLGSAVRLKIALKNDSLQNPTNPGLNPIINTSKISNSVIINSEDILVLGGLMSHNTNENTNKVPFIGDIPVLGYLFQQKSRTVSKKNLMVFIKPIIMQDGNEAMNITEMKYNTVRDKQISFREDVEEIGKKELKTILPPWKNKTELPNPFETSR